ncbi:transcriptional regulator [Streptomyces bacillaris]|uniref:transcriptional regulator n=1 Tax=Streptomyces TaxID=1883 RepID=UPI00158683C4|nr:MULTISPECIES: transcriptional regulator [Streptomyces]NUW20879.1 transcriptional regulator [Streptomyces roseoviolaceus]MBH0246068.1 transcriptional regulator [Streptomyces cavourensis]NUV43716.1 transcriptional regulator [Streptomyces sp. CAI-24]NUV78997.1 transcriptional regulator [Streptomyces sp. CAI-155]NUV86448.1 transcriptional regulator [Streptomyces sp. KAI-26]
MPERNHEFGKFGARGTRGSDLVATRLDTLVDFITTPVTTPRGLLARLRYLTTSPRTRKAAHAAGLTVTDRTLKAWLAGTRSPSKANLERIEQAYRTVRRHNVARHLLKRLNSSGGTRVEIHPLNQSQVPRPHQRALEYRRINVRRWDPIVTAWATGDSHALDTAWTTGILPDLGSQWGQYEYVTNIGFAA